MPVSPVVPVAPVAPDEPVLPIAPVAPVEPELPIAPVAPVAPAGPGALDVAGGVTTVFSQAVRPSVAISAAKSIEYFMMFLCVLKEDRGEVKAGAVRRQLYNCLHTAF